MTRSTPRITAAVILAASGALVLVATLGLAAAKLVIASGDPRVQVSPADAALLADLVALTPFFTAFAVASLVSSLAIALGHEWGDRLGTALATVATSIGAFAFVLVTLGHDAFTNASRFASSANGLGVIAVVTGLYVAVIVALAVAGTVARPPAPQRWSIPGAA
jgi:hypothetical protein